MSESLRTDDFINRVVECYSDMLVRISFTYLKNLSEAEDVAQEVFLKLLEKQPAFENDEHEKAWLIRVVINHSKNRLKTAWFRKTAPLEESIGLATPEEIEVIGAVLELPPKYRSIIQLFYGFTNVAFKMKSSLFKELWSKLDYSQDPVVRKH